MHILLSDKQKNSLRLFRQKAEEIRNHRVVKDWKGTISTKISVENGQVTTQIDGYDLDVFKSFWTTLRQFALNEKEDIFFTKICKAISASCDRIELRKWAKYTRKNWNVLLKEAPIVKVMNREISTKRWEIAKEMATNKILLELWVTGVVFHTDTEKYNYWHALPLHIQNDAMLSIQGLTLQMIGHILTIDAVIRDWLDEPNAEVPPLPSEN